MSHYHDIKASAYTVWFGVTRAFAKPHYQVAPIDEWSPSVHVEARTGASVKETSNAINVVSWNIWRSRYEKHLMNNIAQLRDQGTNVFLLQEVPRFTARQFADHPAVHDMDFVYAPDEFFNEIDRKNGEERVHCGNMILSEYPIVRSSVVDAPVVTRPYSHRRLRHNMVSAVIEPDGAPLQLLSTHLPLECPPRSRAVMLGSLLDGVETVDRSVLGMDANTFWRLLGPVQSVISELNEGKVIAALEKRQYSGQFGNSFSLPPKNLDHIVGRNVDLNARHLFMRGSDHLPVRAKITLRQ